MLENLKADVIYHCSNSDFEMEFNLCGCCRMRLLSDKTSDKKGLVRALAKAVSRSRVIMVCGPLFNEDGLIKIVAAATGKGTQGFDASEYGISGSSEIEIIKGSTPLITTDGYFGGCIIESGPQTIILLTENRSFRKDIMKNLIHPYVEQVSITPINKAKAVAPKTKNTSNEAGLSPMEQENSEFIADVEPVMSQQETQEALESENEYNIEFVTDSSVEDGDEELDCETVEDEAYNDMHIEPEAIKSIKSSYEHDYSASNNDNGYILEDEAASEDEEAAKSGGISNLPLIILTLLLLGALLTLCYFVFLKPYLMGISTAEYITEIFSAAGSV